MKTRVAECDNILQHDNVMSTMIDQAEKMTGSLKSFAKSVNGVMAHLKV